MMLLWQTMPDYWNCLEKLILDAIFLMHTIGLVTLSMMNYSAWLYYTNFGVSAQIFQLYLKYVTITM